MKRYLVKFTGPFGFIKPWTAVRDDEVFTQQFPTPSILAGIERKLFPDLLDRPFGLYKIKAHRLSYDKLAEQQEQIQPRGWNKAKVDGRAAFVRPYAIVKRSVMVNPILWLAFENWEDALVASEQHVCLSRNEDILLPSASIEIVNIDDFNKDEETFNGFELVFEERKDSFLVGYNRFDGGRPMFGWLRIVGNPINSFV